jgi:hypothetical protein
MDRICAQMEYQPVIVQLVYNTETKCYYLQKLNKGVKLLFEFLSADFTEAITAYHTYCQEVLAEIRAT